MITKFFTQKDQKCLVCLSFFEEISTADQNQL